MKSTASLKYCAVIYVTLAVTSLLLQAGKSDRPKPSSGSQLYMASCAPCHQTGGNMIDSGKKIVGSKQLANKNLFRKFLSGQHAQMPPWKTIVKDESALNQLYDYVKKLK